MKEAFLRAAGMTGRVLGWTALALAVAWAALALWLDGPASRSFAGMAAVGFVLVAAAGVAFIRPRWKGVALAVTGVAAVATWWSRIEPNNYRDWRPEVSRIASWRRDGDRIVLENVRDFQYRSATDFTERWIRREFDLSRVRGVDMYMSNWGPSLICHTIASFEFDDVRPFAVSIETRKEKGEEYSALRGLYKGFELHYVFAEERDEIGLRAAHLGERVHLYRLKGGRLEARALLEEYLRAVRRLDLEPRWYNAVTTNCTTSIRDNARQAAGVGPFDLRLLLNGDLDRLGYERGKIDTSMPFESLRATSDITGKVKAAAGAGAAEFSTRIRQGLPGARR
ncbi:MAG TPA: DUF4105 domain-containing protein [Planctomycetota bacterium]|nr:DUF4105 domain-containing protein [Planctomycetota bacterium]